jgi:hypothetical protein
MAGFITLQNTGRRPLGIRFQPHHHIDFVATKGTKHVPVVPERTDDSPLLSLVEIHEDDKHGTPRQEAAE